MALNTCVNAPLSKLSVFVVGAIAAILPLSYKPLRAYVQRSRITSVVYAGYCFSVVVIGMVVWNLDQSRYRQELSDEILSIHQKFCGRNGSVVGNLTPD